jgi:hypothetical protein
VFDFPNNPTNGSIATGPNGATWQWDGVKWIATSATGQTIVVSDTPPPNPLPGMLWWCSDVSSGQLYVYVQDANSSQWVQANSLNANVGAAIAPAWNNAGRNLVMNPYFNIAQRGVGPWTTGGIYTLDRWYLSFVTDTVSVSQIALADADRAAIGDEAALVAHQNVFTGNAAAGASTVIYQGIESVRRLSGKTVTLSFWAKCNSGALKLGINYLQSFGSGGSPSASAWANTTGQSVTLSTTWARYSLTTTIPSAAGKTLGTNNNDCTFMFVAYSSGATNNALYGNIGVQSGAIQLWGIQLEIQTPGQTAPTPLEKIDPGEDLKRCQRFYQTGIYGDNNYAIAGVGVGGSQQFVTTMRANPTIVLSGQTYINCSGASVSSVSVNGATFSASTTGTGGTVWNTNYTASADL